MKSAKYRVRLSDEERVHLRELIASGTAPAKQLTRVRILLKADEQGPGWTDNQIVAALDVSDTTVAKVRRQFVQAGLAAVLERRAPQRDYTRCLDGVGEAHLVALVCSPAPEGHQRWTLQLLADTLVELGYAQHVSYETVRQVLKKRTQTLA